MKSLRQLVGEHIEANTAVGHFNFANIEMLWGIFRAARERNEPVIFGTSEGERHFVGTRQAIALVRSLRDEYDYPVFINADHTYSYEGVVEAVDAGYDSVIFDGTKLPFEENIEISKKCVAYARSKNPEIVIEGEVGFIGSSSKVLEEIPAGVEISREHLTTPEDLERYVRETGVDMVAPAVGNLHGMLKGGTNPHIDIELIEQLSKAAGIPLVLHGGSGITDDDLLAGIEHGLGIIHVSTELRLAFRKSVTLALQENPDEIAPYKLMKEPVKAVQDIVGHHIDLFIGKKRN